jgi:allophanate hydrolase
MTAFVFYGTFMHGQPGHQNLVEATYLEDVRTAALYRLFYVDGRWPALIPDDEGAEIECELYETPEDLLARLAQIEPPGWERTALQLVDGRTVEAFLGGPELRRRGVDISAHGGWAAFVRT